MEEEEVINTPAESAPDTQQQEPQINSVEDITDEDFEAWYARTMVDNEDSPVQEEPPTNELVEENAQPEQPEESNKDIPKYEEEEELFEIKANGITHQVTLEELKQLAPKAFDYTKKMQEIAPMRKTLNAMKENNITAEDINQLIDIKKGNTSAKQDFLKKYGLDSLEYPTDEYGNPIEQENNYRPNDYGTEPTPVSEILESLADRPRFPEFRKIIFNLDNVSKQEITNDPELLNVMMNEIECGAYQIVNNEVIKMNTLNPRDNRSYLAKYAEASQKLAKRVRAERERSQLSKDIQTLSDKRKAASLTGNKNITANLASGVKEIKSVYDISDSELDKFLMNVGYSR